MIDKYGSWQVADKIFYNSYDAYKYSSDILTRCYFNYHHAVWEKFDRSQLGKHSLPYLYKLRAQQLRDNYDYLILYYSGGADSHNILKTFVDNNIKLDEVCIKWPKPLVDGKFYNVNSLDTSASNYWSEWDYCVKPVLDWLKNNKPEIKIVIKDFIGNPDQFDVDQLFTESTCHGFHAGLLLNSKVSDSEIEMINKGKTVGNIYGVDKPLLELDSQNNISIFFLESTMMTAVRSIANPYGAELFYWSPNMPIIVFEQAYQLAEYYRINTDDKKFLIKPVNERKPTDLSTTEQSLAQHQIAKKIIYEHTWDDRFQSLKPGSKARIDKFNWFFECTEFDRMRDIFMDNVNQRLKLLHQNYVVTETYKNMSVKSLVNNVKSPSYFVTRL